MLRGDSIGNGFCAFEADLALERSYRHGCPRSCAVYMSHRVLGEVEERMVMALVGKRGITVC
jgi:hypothetical protein